MISKSRISDVRKLHLKKFRDAEGLFVVEGWKCVEMLLQSSYKVMDVFATEESAIAYASSLKGCSPTIATPNEMERMSALSTSPDLLAVVQKKAKLPALDNDAPLLVLDRIADPGNLGTIIRTADWFNITQIVCSPDCVDLYNPKTIQASMGSFCHVDVRTADLVPFLAEQKTFRRILGTFLNGNSVYDFNFDRHDAIVIGSESHGIREQVEPLITEKITIPHTTANRPTAESLNAGVAAAIVMERFSSHLALS